MTITPAAARLIGKEMAKAVLTANAKYMRLSVASAQYGPSEQTLLEASHKSGAARLRVIRRKLPDAKRRMTLVTPKEMDRWIQENFEETPECEKTPVGGSN
jgi:hypothetical protein